jgi:hypothetical protein
VKKWPSISKELALLQILEDIEEEYAPNPKLFRTEDDSYLQALDCQYIQKNDGSSFTNLERIEEEIR